MTIAYLKERLPDFYATADARRARQVLEKLGPRCRNPSMPPEVQQLGRTILRWSDKLCNHHLAKVSNCPTETLDNLIKLVKTDFGFRNFESYRIRALMYAGKPNWRALSSTVVR